MLKMVDLELKWHRDPNGIAYNTSVPLGKNTIKHLPGGQLFSCLATSGGGKEGGWVFEPISHSWSQYTCITLTPRPCRPAMNMSIELCAVTPTAMGALFSVVFTATR